MSGSMTGCNYAALAGVVREYDRAVLALETALAGRGLRREQRTRYGRMLKHAKRKQGAAVRDAWRCYEKNVMGESGNRSLAGGGVGADVWVGTPRSVDGGVLASREIAGIEVEAVR